MINLAIAAAMSIMNRIRGGGFWIGEWFDEDNPKKLPGRALYPVTLGVMGLAWFTSGSWILGLIVALGYILWASPPWGHLIPLGNIPMVRNKSKLEEYLQKYTSSPDNALFFRMFIFVFPLFIALAIWYSNPLLVLLSGGFAEAIVYCYRFGWFVHGYMKGTYFVNPYLVAEMCVGLLWGILIAML